MTKSIYDQLVTSNTNSLVYNVSTGGSGFNGMASGAPSGGVRARQGVKILANFAGIGSTIQNVTIGIRKNGTVSGTVNVQYINASYEILAKSSMNAIDLGNGDTDTYNFTLSSQVTIASGDRLLIQYNSTAWSNGVVLNGTSGTRPTNTTYTYEDGALNSNSFTDGSGSGVPMMAFDSVNTGVLKQRFVETFSGDALDTDRWGVMEGTCVSSDSIDGGVILTSGTGLYAGGTFGFANSGSTVPAVSPFANPCTMIYNLRSATVTQPNTHGAGMVGQIRGDMAGNNSALWCERASFTKWKQRNINSSGLQSDVESTEPYTQDNQDWHNFKLDIDPSNVKGSIDGVLATTNSGYVPFTKLCPMFGIQNQGNGSATSLEINYCEVYNR